MCCVFVVFKWRIPEIDLAPHPEGGVMRIDTVDAMVLRPGDKSERPASHLNGDVASRCGSGHRQNLSRRTSNLGPTAMSVLSRKTMRASPVSPVFTSSFVKTSLPEERADSFSA